MEFTHALLLIIAVILFFTLLSLVAIYEQIAEHLGIKQNAYPGMNLITMIFYIFVVLTIWVVWNYNFIWDFLTNLAKSMQNL